MNESFFYPWLAFSIITLVFAAVVFFWGLKTGKFPREDRMSYLPLWAYVPEEEEKEQEEDEMKTM